MMRTFCTNFSGEGLRSDGDSKTRTNLRIKPNEYYEYFGPDYTLHVDPSNMENLNTPEDMERIRNTLLEQISRLPHAPSAPFQTTPSTTEALEEAEEDMDKRPKRPKWNGEDYDSDYDEDEKPIAKCSNFTAHTRDVANDMEEEKPEVHPSS